MILRLAKRIAGRILRLLPEPLVGRILPPAFRFDLSRMPAPARADETDIRLWIAPVNYAGQGRAWARAAEEHLPGVSARNMVVRVGGDFRHPADEVVPLGFYAASRSWQVREFQAVTKVFTHVMVEAERQPFGAVLDETTESQVHRLLERGVHVAMLCHGTDIRLPSRHRAGNSSSPFHDTMAAAAPRLERIASHNARLLARLALPVFVSTPDLLQDVPAATWLPVVVDSDRWAGHREPFQRARPVVVHAPSSGPAKGSELIDPVLQRLHDDGIIEYRRLRGVPYEQMRDAYGDADVVVDQVRIGDYGVAACEAMAAGRLVVGHVSSRVRQEIRGTLGWDLPIVEAEVGQLEAVIRRVLEDRDGARATTERGVAFVRNLHNGRVSADRLRTFLVSGKAS